MSRSLVLVFWRTPDTAPLGVDPISVPVIGTALIAAIRAFYDGAGKDGFHDQGDG